MVFARSFQGFGRQLAFQRFLALLQQNSSSLLPCLPPDVVFPLFDLESLVAVEEIGTMDDGQTIGTKGYKDGTFESCKKVSLCKKIGLIQTRLCECAKTKIVK